MPINFPAQYDNQGTQGVAASGGGSFGYHLSGIAAPSGDVSAAWMNFDASGPWYIETQDLEIDYRRVPIGASEPRFDLNEYSDLTLSSWSSNEIDRNVVGGASGDISRTGLVCRVKATVTKLKSTDMYNTSAYQQPQKFQVYALSADKRGLSCGTVGTDMMGPQGRIESAQIWFNRRTWNESLDASAVGTSSVECYNFLIQTNGAASGYPECASGNEAYWFDKDACHSRQLMNLRPRGAPPGIDRGTELIVKQGNYTTGQDSTTDVQRLCSNIAFHLATTWGLYNTEHRPGINETPGDRGYLPTYNENRHDFS